jgi:phosphohistidine phosphatase
MPIYLIRHAEAVDETREVREPARHLTASGRAAALELGAVLLARGIAFDRIVTSHFVRAVQTAELVAAAVGYPGIVESVPTLAPDGDARVAAATLKALAGAGAVIAAVGHEPNISAVAAVLLERTSHTALPKASALAITLEGAQIIRAE